MPLKFTTLSHVGQISVDIVQLPRVYPQDQISPSLTYFLPTVHYPPLTLYFFSA